MFAELHHREFDLAPKMEMWKRKRMSARFLTKTEVNHNADK